MLLVIGAEYPQEFLVELFRGRVACVDCMINELSEFGV